MVGCTNRSWIITVSVLYVILSCARQAAPSGGPRDVTPPKVVKSEPLNASLNFKGNKIIITFDEFIDLDKITDKFMISPPLNKKPNILKRGKNIDIEFLEKLKDSTTYTLYFQDAIRDLNEGNAISNFQFVFSTGNVIDSLSVTGNVYNASDLEIPENTLVTMYRHLADSAPQKLLPDYITQVDINGGFRINNIKEGIYRIYALQDKNNNKKYDLADEPFAFMDEPVSITIGKNYLPVKVEKDTVKTVPAKGVAVAKKTPVVPFIDGEYKLYLSVAPLKKHYLTSTNRKTAQHLTYTLSLPPAPSQFDFKIPDSDQKSYFIEKNITGDSIEVWITDSLVYSKQQINSVVSFPFTDSTGVTKIKSDSVPMRFISTRSSRNKEAMSKYLVATNIMGGTLKPGQQISFTSLTPFRMPDTTRIHLYEVLKTGIIVTPFRIIKDTMDSKRYFFSAKFKEGSVYRLFGEKASFGDIYNDDVDSVSIRFQVRRTDSYGSIMMNLTSVSGPVIVQLLDPREMVISQKRIKVPGKVDFPLIDIGNYKVRVIYDTNGDGKWTTGDYIYKRQPEAVSYFGKEIDVKIDWDLIEDWDIVIQHQKDQKLRSKKI